MLDEKRYGEYYADGGKRDPDLSALSGKPLSTGHVTVMVSPHHFVVVNAAEKLALAPADWQAVKEDWKHQFADLKASAGPDVVESASPDFENMTIADLKTYAADNGIDLGARRSQAQIASGIRAAMAMRQFDTPATVSTGEAPAPVPEGGI